MLAQPVGNQSAAEQATTRQAHALKLTTNNGRKRKQKEIENKHNELKKKLK
jgi:hypothetical protein